MTRKIQNVSFFGQQPPSMYIQSLTIVGGVAQKMTRLGQKIQNVSFLEQQPPSMSIKSLLLLGGVAQKMTRYGQKIQTKFDPDISLTKIHRKK